MTKVKLLVIACIIGVISSGVAVQLSVGGQKDIIEDMDDAEERYQERLKNERVLFMSFDKLFPEEKLRALAEAAGDGDVDEIDALVSEGVDVNGKGSLGVTPLYAALEDIDGFRRLLQHGADPNVVYDDGLAIMHLLARRDDSRFLESALKHGGDPNLRVGFNSSPLLFDTLDRPNNRKLLLRHGAELNAQNKLGMTFVFYAAIQDRFDVVYELLEKGADYRIEYKWGKNLIDKIVESRPNYIRTHEQFDWMEKTIAWLRSDGATVPIKGD